MDESTFDVLFSYINLVNFIVLFFLIFIAIVMLFIYNNTYVIIRELNEVNSNLDEIHEITVTNAVCPS